MYCGNCGAKNEDDAVFCGTCGSKLKESKTDELEGNMQLDVNPNSEFKYKKSKNVGISVIIGITIAIAVLCSLFVAPRSYKELIKDYFKFTFKGNVEEMVDMVPEKILYQALREEGYTLEEFITQAEEEIQSLLEYLENNVGEDFKVNYNIQSQEDVIGDELEEIRAEYESFDVDIKKAKSVDLEIYVKNNGEEETVDLSLSLVKIGRSWYLDLYSMGGLF